MLSQWCPSGIVGTMNNASSRRINEDAALRAVVEGTVSSTGDAFYRALVENLADALDTRGAWVTSYDRDARKLRALAFRFGGEWVEDFIYWVEGTPCETAVDERRLVHIPDRVIELYPNEVDPAVQVMAGVVSYLGAPILDERNHVIGHIAVVDDQPMPDEKRLVSLFQIFAERASAEMRRTKLENEVKEREEKLSLLVGSAMDAIVELDTNLSITMMNNAAERMFGCKASRLQRQRLEHLLGVDADEDGFTARDRTGETPHRRKTPVDPGATDRRTAGRGAVSHRRNHFSLRCS